MRRLIPLLTLLAACGFPEQQGECLPDGGVYDSPDAFPKTEADCVNPDRQRAVWVPAGACAIFHVDTLGPERFDCSAFLSCSGDLRCVPENAVVEWGDPDDCSCGRLP